MEFLHGPSTQTTNTDLAAALGTLGIPRDPVQPLQVLVGEIEQVAFFFGIGSPCGVYQTGHMIAAWDDSHWATSHPRHALAYMRSGLRNRSRLLEYAKGTTRIGISGRPGGRLEAVPVTHHVSRPASSSAQVPDAATTPRLQTDDLELAACLLACGIPLWRDMPIERRGTELSFFFHAASPCGQFHTRHLMLAWQDAHWHIAHPEHPFAYLSCAFENRRRLLREVKQKVPMVTFLRAGYPQFLSLNADPKTESTFMAELAKL
jgi:hypothetical protein